MIRTVIRNLSVAIATTLLASAAIAQLQPGDQSRWSLDFRARMEQGSAKPIEVHLNGDYLSTITAVRAGESDAQIELAGLHFTGEPTDSASPAALKDLQSRLSRPFWATYRSDGGLIAIHFYRDVRPADRNLLQMIASELQLVRPDGEHASSPVQWTAQERDGAGEYSALYLMPQPDRILKRKLKYAFTDGVAGAPTDAVHVSIDQSEISFAIAPDGRIASVDGNNRVRMDLAPMDLSMDKALDKTNQLAAVTEFHLTNLRTATAPQLIGSLDRARPDVASSPIVTQRPDPATVRAEADERLLNGYTSTALLSAAFKKDVAMSGLPDRLTALFRSRPDAASAAVSLLIKNGPQRTVTNALGAAGSPSAVAALESLAANKTLAENLRVDAIVAFVQMQHPTAEAMLAPQSLMQDPNVAVQSAAHMMSGALSRAGRAEHPDQSDETDASLNVLYKNAHDPHQKTELLAALGNSAGPSLIATIAEALHDSNTTIRAAAARAMRLAPGPDVDRMLADVITSDNDAHVRSDAIFAARFRHPLPAVLADALMQAATTDYTDYVRSDAVAVLRQNPTASPRIQETLQQIAQSDADKSIRRQAQEALASISPATSVHR